MQITHTPPACPPSFWRISKNFYFILLLFLSQMVFAQVVIKDTVEIAPRKSFPPSLITTTQTTTEVTDNGFMFTLRLFMSHTAANELRVNKLVFNGVPVFDFHCGPVSFIGTALGIDTTTRTSMTGVTVEAYGCSNGSYIPMVVELKQVTPTSYAVYFNGNSKPGVGIGVDEVPLPTMSLSPTSVHVHLTKNNQPNVTFTERHTPVTSQYVPTIQWLSDYSFNLSSYYQQLADLDSLIIPISAKATNVRGSVTVTTTLKLTSYKGPDAFQFDILPDAILYADTAALKNFVVFDAYGREMPGNNGTVTLTALPPGNGGMNFPGGNPDYDDTYWNVSYNKLRTIGMNYLSGGYFSVVDKPVNITATYRDPLGTVSRIKGLVIKATNFCPVVILSDSSILPRDRVTVETREKREDGLLLPNWWRPVSPYKIEIVSGREYGSFYSRGEQFYEREWDGRHPPIEFVADSTINVDSALVVLRVTSAESISPCYDSTVLVIKGIKKKLKITNHEPREMWPLLTGASARGLKDYKPNRSFTIKVTDASDKPVSGEKVKIFTEHVPLRGGHQHNNPVLEQTKQGKFYGGGKEGNPLVLQTDSNGIIEIGKYEASEVSGEYLVTAQLETDNTVKDTVKMIVKVPNLIAFTGVGEYILKGSTTTHPANHFFYSQSAVNDLIEAANAFRKQKWNTTDAMRLNDMSLEGGGLFDLNKIWTNGKGHNLHRVGKSVDIENLELEKVIVTIVETQRDTVFTVPKVKFIEKFVEFMQTTMKNWKFIDEHQMVEDVFERTRMYPHFEWKGK